MLVTSVLTRVGKHVSPRVVAVAFLSVIPSGNPLLQLFWLLPLPFFLSFPQGICCCSCLGCCRCFSFCHSAGNPLLQLPWLLPLPFFLSFPQGICCYPGRQGILTIPDYLANIFVIFQTDFTRRFHRKSKICNSAGDSHFAVDPQTGSTAHSELSNQSDRKPGKLVTSQLRITRVLAISSCLWAALALTQRTQAQATPDPDPQLQDCYTVHPPDPNDLQPPQDEPNWNGRFQAYSDLIIAAVSDEDHQKFGALQDDLSKGLGITIEEDRAVRQIFVDAQRRGRLAW